MKNNNKSQQDLHDNYIPDITIIDLEDDGSSEKQEPVSDKPNAKSTDKQAQGFRRFLNIHVILAATFVLFIVGIFYSLNNWGVEINLDDIIKDDESEYSDTLDNILPLMNFEGENPADDDETVIVCFGNAPFADDRGSEDNLANLIAKEANATVYNCAIGDSYLAALSPYFHSVSQPLDAYNFYWMITLATGGPVEHFFKDSAQTLGDATPPEAEEVYELLTTIDFNKVDVVAVMYDASDYLAGNPMYNDANNTDITQFTGNLEAGIELLNAVYPHIRVIVMSPTYAFAVDQNGDYMSSDMMTYGHDVLSTYVIKQADSAAYWSTSFLDNLYGTITEDNANEYLTDHLHLNVKGRRLVAKRFVDDALYRYD